MKVVVATACAAGAPGEQTPTPDSLVPERQMPLLPEPELETPLLLQPVLSVPELGPQVDCGARGRSSASLGVQGEEGTVFGRGEADADGGARGNCESSDCCSGDARVAGSNSRTDNRAAWKRFIEVSNMTVAV